MMLPDSRVPYRPEDKHPTWSMELVSRYLHRRIRLEGRALSPLILAGFAIAIRIHLQPVITDDAYITFRYADNIATGVGFVYNEGERVLGTTTPLFTLLLAVLRIGAGIPPDKSSVWVAAISDAVTALLLYRLAAALSRDTRPGLLAGLLFSVSPFAIRFSVNGMETSLGAALILATLVLHVNRRLLGAALLCALAIMTRPEAVLLAALIAFDLARTGSFRRAGSFIGCVLALLAPWVCFAALYFGNPIPHSLIAKSALLYQWAPIQTLAMFLSNFAFIILGYPLGRLAGVPWPGGIPDLGPPAGWLLAGVLALVQGFLVLRGVQWTSTYQNRVWIVAGFPFLYLVSYLGSSVRHVLIFDWYLAPLQPFYLLFLALGLFSSSRGARSRPLLFLSALLVLSQLSGLGWTPSDFGRPLDASAGREAEYQEVATRYSSSFGRETLVAAAEIGALGYFSEARILDTVGLISPIALRYYPLPPDMYISSYAIPPELIRNAQPDFLVTMEVFVSRGLLREQWFLNEYEEIYRKPTKAFRGTHLLVFRRLSPRLQN